MNVLAELRSRRSVLRSLRKNKTVYTAALVADGWAGAENLEKELCDGPTNQPTKKWLIE